MTIRNGIKTMSGLDNYNVSHVDANFRLNFSSSFCVILGRKKSLISMCHVGSLCELDFNLPVMKACSSRLNKYVVHQFSEACQILFMK